MPRLWGRQMEDKVERKEELPAGVCWVYDSGVDTARGREDISQLP